MTIAALRVNRAKLRENYAIIVRGVRGTGCWAASYAIIGESHKRGNYALCNHG